MKKESKRIKPSSLFVNLAFRNKRLIGKCQPKNLLQITSSNLEIHKFKTNPHEKNNLRETKMKEESERVKPSQKSCIQKQEADSKMSTKKFAATRSIDPKILKFIQTHVSKKNL